MTNQSTQDRFKAQPHHRVHTPTQGRTLFTIIITLMAILLTGPSVFATPTLLIDGGGQLTGASGVDVGGTLYDVTFVDGTCIDVFNGCSQSDFFFHNNASAFSAAQALLDQVFLNSGLGNFDSIPSLTLGCESSIMCRPSTPYLKRGLNLRTEDAANDTEDAKDKARLELYTESEDLGIQDIHVWAQWSDYTPIESPIESPIGNGDPETAPVPEPTTMVLLSSGLFGLIGYRWRQQRAEQLNVG